MKYSLFKSIVTTIVFISISMLSSINVYSQDKANTTNSDMPKFLAIQYAQSGSINKINSTSYALELNDLSKKTILFSDRPDRIVKSTSTSDFIGNWTVGEDSYSLDAPNAVLVIDEQDGKQDLALVELFNPVYDLDRKSIKYYVTPDNTTSIYVPREFGQLTLIIDEVGRDHILIRDKNGR